MMERNQLYHDKYESSDTVYGKQATPETWFGFVKNSYT